MQEFIPGIAVAFVAAFLLGSIPFGLVISKLFYKTDIRKHGSGNIGTTNAIRTMGKKGGFAVFLLDFGKGLLSGFLALWIGGLSLHLRGHELGLGDLFGVLRPFGLGPIGDGSLFSVQLTETLLAFAILGCVLGHIFSPWLKFRGGKGIAVAIGCLFVAIGVVGAVLELLIFTSLVLITRYVSVGSIASAAACPFFGLLYYWGNWPAILCLTILGCAVVWAHRQNIKRLIAGNESRVGSKKKAESGEKK
ncbi:MAG: glycerol-3-phosphate 1-O-acyltransferase PlsY [Eggerthellaceae bacterium]|nr:glycerol-3-phosphate 1-O-acyltransferase PlsY [Eggerthellaceae bacterium]